MPDRDVTADMPPHEVDTFPSWLGRDAIAAVETVRSLDAIPAVAEARRLQAAAMSAVLADLSAAADAALSWTDEAAAAAAVADAATDEAWAEVERLVVRAVVPITDWAARTLRPRQWLIDDWLPRGRLTMLHGRGGGGKSRLALQLAVALTRIGGDGIWLPPSPRGGHHMPLVDADVCESPCVVVSAEDDPDEILRRLLEVSLAADPAELGDMLSDRLALIDGRGRGPMYGPKVGAHMATRAEMLPFGGEVLARAADRGARLLILDPLAAVYGGSEIERAAVREFAGYLDMWAQKHDCAVLILAHPSKSDGDELSGSTDWHAAPRAVWRLSQRAAANKRNTATALRLDRTKLSYGPLTRDSAGDDAGGTWVAWHDVADSNGGRWTAAAEFPGGDAHGDSATAEDLTGQRYEPSAEPRMDLE